MLFLGLRVEMRWIEFCHVEIFCGGVDEFGVDGAWWGVGEFCDEC